MKKSGVGVGSASIILVFAVLCLTVFSLITLLVARNDKALVDAEVELVVGYYEADALAERVFAEIRKAGVITDSIPGVDIKTDLDIESGNGLVEYTCKISDKKALTVKLAVDDSSFEILSWKMIDTEEWVFDDKLNVWDGE